MLFSLILLSVFLLNSCKKSHSSNFSCSPNCPTPDPPTVQSVAPPKNATLVPLNAQISATFSKSMQPATLSTNTFIVTGGGAQISGDIAYTEATKTVTFIPKTSFSAGTNYTVVITNGVEDSTLINMAGSYTWSFTTGTSLDTVAPAFSNNNPQISANPTSSNTISISWTVAKDDTTPQDQITYDICLSTGATDCAAVPFPDVITGGPVIRYETIEGTTFLGVTGLEKKTTYYFVVRAKDLAGNIDANTAVAQATTFGDWVALGVSLNNNKHVDAVDPSISLAGTVPYLAWSEGSIPANVYTRAFDATSKVWSPAIQVNTQLTHAEAARVASDGAISPTPHLTYTECADPASSQWNPANGGSANICKVYVKRWNGTIWQPVGDLLNVDATKSARDSAIAFDNSTPPIPYVIWIEFDGTVDQVYVKHFNGTTWVQDGANLNLDSLRNGRDPAIAIDGTAVRAAWSECVGSSANCELYVKKWDIASSTAWSLSGPGSLKVGSAPAHPSLSFINHLLHIAWNESAQVYIKKETSVGFDSLGIIPEAASVASNVTLGGTASPTQIPYFVFADNTTLGPSEPLPPHIIAKRWTGADWVTEGSGRLNMTFSGSSQTINSSISFGQGTPYIAWMERGQCLTFDLCGTNGDTLHSQIYVKRLE